MDSLIQVAVIDDEEILLNQFEHWIAPADAGIAVVTTTRTVDEFLLANSPAKIVLLDLLLRDDHTPAHNVRRLVTAGRSVVAFSSRDNPVYIRDAIAAGAHSYVHKAKDPDELCAAVKAVHRGEGYTSRAHAAAMESAKDNAGARLSIQEREALRLYASGMTIAEVAMRMNIEPSTAKGYLDRARRKYESLGRPAHTKIDLRKRAVEDGLLGLPDSQ